MSVQQNYSEIVFVPHSRQSPYKDRTVSTVSGDQCCLIQEWYTTHKHRVGTFRRVVHIDTTLSSRGMRNYSRLQISECRLSVPISNAEPTDDVFSQNVYEPYSCGSYRVSRDPTGCEVIPKCQKIPTTYKKYLLPQPVSQPLFFCDK